MGQALFTGSTVNIWIDQVINNVPGPLNQGSVFIYLFICIYAEICIFSVPWRKCMREES